MVALLAILHFFLRKDATGAYEVYTVKCKRKMG
jgi:hypothetical protein